MMESIHNMADKFFLLKKRLREPDLKDLLNHSDRSLISKFKSYRMENQKTIEPPKQSKTFFVNVNVSTVKPIKQEVVNDVLPMNHNRHDANEGNNQQSPLSSSVRKNPKKTKPPKTKTAQQLPLDNLLTLAFDKNPFKKTTTPIIKQNDMTVHEQNDKEKQKMKEKEAEKERIEQAKKKAEEEEKEREKEKDRLKEIMQKNYEDDSEEDILMKDNDDDDDGNNDDDDNNGDHTPAVEEDDKHNSNSLLNTKDKDNNYQDDDDNVSNKSNDSAIFEKNNIWNDDDESPGIESFNSEPFCNEKDKPRINEENTNEKLQSRNNDPSLNKFVQCRHKDNKPREVIADNDALMKNNAIEKEELRNSNEDVDMLPYNNEDNEEDNGSEKGKAIVLRDNKVIISLKDLGSFDLHKKSSSNQSSYISDNDEDYKYDDEEMIVNEEPKEKDNKPSHAAVNTKTVNDMNKQHENVNRTSHKVHKRHEQSKEKTQKNNQNLNTIKKNTKIIDDDDEKDYAYDNNTYHLNEPKNDNESNNYPAVTMEGTQLKFNLNMNIMSPTIISNKKETKEHDKDKERNKEKIQEKDKERHHTHHIPLSPYSNQKKTDRKISTSSNKQMSKHHHSNTSLNKYQSNSSTNPIINQVKPNHINPLKSTKPSNNTNASLIPLQKPSNILQANSTHNLPKTLNSIQSILSDNSIKKAPTPTANDIVIKKREHDIVCLSTLDSLLGKLHKKMLAQSSQNSSSSSQIKEVFDETSKIIIQVGKEEHPRRIKAITEKTMKLLVVLFDLLQTEKQRDLYISDVQHIIDTIHTFQHKSKVAYGSKMPQWLKLHKVALKFTLSLFCIKTYTSNQLKEIINQSKNDNKNSNMNLIKFAKSYKSYNNACVKLNEILEKAKGSNNNHEDSKWKRQSEDIMEYLKINPTISRHSKCFKLCKKIIEFVFYYISSEKIKE